MALGDDPVKTIETTKRRPDTVPAGTRESSVVLSTMGKSRKAVMDRGLNIVTLAYEQKWGEVPWDLVRVTYHFLTVQVAVVLEVRP